MSPEIGDRQQTPVSQRRDSGIGIGCREDDHYHDVDHDHHEEHEVHGNDDPMLDRNELELPLKPVYQRQSTSGTFSMEDPTDNLITTECDIQTVGDYRYSLRRVLGEGTFGIVFRGWHVEEPQRHVAIKRVNKENVKHQELSLIQSMSSKHVVNIREVVEQGEYVFVVMELCACTLDDHLQHLAQCGLKMCPNDVLTVLYSLAHGFLHLHQRNLIHRDVKPQNVLIQYEKDINFTCSRCSHPHTPISSAKIADFGTARSSRKSMSNLCGTPFYMAPEVGANVVCENEYTQKVDMWSVGVLLYECTTGELPFDESQLCKLFLQSCTSQNYKRTPSQPAARGPCPVLTDAMVHPSTSQANLHLYNQLFPRLLNVDVRRRANASELYACIRNWQSANTTDPGVIALQSRWSFPSCALSPIHETLGHSSSYGGDGWMWTLLRTLSMYLMYNCDASMAQMAADLYR